MNAIAENRVPLASTAAVKATVSFTLFSPDATTAFKPNIRTNNFMKHINYFWMVNKNTGGASRYVSMFGW
jgi:hypothetical protein